MSIKVYTRKEERLIKRALEKTKEKDREGGRSYTFQRGKTAVSSAKLASTRSHAKLVTLDRRYQRDRETKASLLYGRYNFLELDFRSALLVHRLPRGRCGISSSVIVLIYKQSYAANVEREVRLLRY